MTEYDHEQPNHERMGLATALAAFVVTPLVAYVVGALVGIVIASASAAGGDGQVLTILVGGVVGVLVGLVFVVLALVRGRSLGWSIKWSSIATSVVCIGLVARMVS